MLEDSSINLCWVDGVEAVGLLYEKIRNPDFPLNIGTFACQRITKIVHVGASTLAFEVVDAKKEKLAFSFTPDTTPFAESAVNANDQPICSG